MVGDGRRLATELVVFSASATHEIQATGGAPVRAAAGAAAFPAGTSLVLIAPTPRLAGQWYS